MQVIIYWLLIIVMVVGIIGAVVPGLPGSGLILTSIIIWGILGGSFAAIKTPLIVTVLVLVLSIGVDILASYLGAKKAGASKWGQIGAIVGLIVGFFGLLPTLPFGSPLSGISLGPILVAIIRQFIYRRQLWLAVKADIGIIVGSLIGNLIQGVLAIAAVVVFIITTWPQVYGA